MKIAITGVPGCGKTKIARLLTKRINYNLIDLNKLIKKKKLYEKYDKKLKTFIVDIKKMKKLKFDNDVVIESHLSHFLKNIDLVIVLRCNPKELKKRLRKKKWDKEKIRENFEAELIDLISIEARKYHKNVYDVDSTKSPEKTVKEIRKILKYKGYKYKKIISWIR